MLQSNGVGTAVIARHNVSLAANPLQIVRRGSCHGVRKKRKPVQLDVNGHCGWSFFRGRFQSATQSPGHSRIEILELQSSLLQRNLFKILIDAHEVFPREARNHILARSCCRFSCARQAESSDHIDVVNLEELSSCAERLLTAIA